MQIEFIKEIARKAGEVVGKNYKGKFEVGIKKELKDSVFIFNKSYQHYSKLAGLTRVLGDFLLTTRTFGATSLDLCQVATGRVDGLVNLSAATWDYAAGCLIATEAKAVATNFFGNSINTNKREELLASLPANRPQANSAFSSGPVGFKDASIIL